jgi:hypothetical protein
MKSTGEDCVQETQRRSDAADSRNVTALPGEAGDGLLNLVIRLTQLQADAAYPSVGDIDGVWCLRTVGGVR